MNARRFFAGAGVFAVAGVAAAISYRHQQHLAATHGQPEALAIIWPLCVDGLVASTGIAIANDRASGDLPRIWALVGFWLGVTVSVVTNWLATAGGLTNHGISAFPAVAFLLAIESLTGRPRPRTVAATVPDAVAVRAGAVAVRQDTRETAARTLVGAEDTAPVPALSKADRMRRTYAEALASGQRMTHRDLAEATGADLSHARRVHGRLVRDYATTAAPSGA